MKTNNLLTYLLYALLLGLILAAGYKACQMKKEKQLLAEKQEAELQQTLHDMGYKTADSTAANGSTYGGNEAATDANASKPTASKEGIEDEPSASQPAAATKKTDKSATSSLSSTNTAPKTTTKTTSKSIDAAASAKPKAKTLTKSTAVRDLDTDTRGGRYQVRAGAFTKMEGARRQLETVIKLGYTNAEIGKTNKGKYAVVVAMRSDNKAEAIAVADKLEARGLDAAVVDSHRKN